MDTTTNSNITHINLEIYNELLQNSDDLYMVDFWAKTVKLPTKIIKSKSPENLRILFVFLIFKSITTKVYNGLLFPFIMNKCFNKK